jgi:hypothetical protein
MNICDLCTGRHQTRNCPKAKQAYREALLMRKEVDRLIVTQELRTANSYVLEQTWHDGYRPPHGDT